MDQQYNLVTVNKALDDYYGLHRVVQDRELFIAQKKGVETPVITYDLYPYNNDDYCSLDGLENELGIVKLYQYAYYATGTPNVIGKSYKSVFNHFINGTIPYPVKMRSFVDKDNFPDDALRLFVGNKYISLEPNSRYKPPIVLCALMDVKGCGSEDDYNQSAKINPTDTCKLYIDPVWKASTNTFVRRIYKRFHTEFEQAYLDLGVPIEYRTNLSEHLFKQLRKIKFSTIGERLEYNKSLYRFINLHNVVKDVKQKQDSREQLGERGQERPTIPSDGELEFS